jgi:hypothetical protein
VRVGDECVVQLSQFTQLTSLAVIRNFWEPCAAITAKSLLALSKCKLLEHLELVYSREFVHVDCLGSLTRLRRLCLDQCTI